MNILICTKRVSICKSFDLEQKHFSDKCKLIFHEHDGDIPLAGIDFIIHVEPQHPHLSPQITNLRTTNIPKAVIYIDLHYMPEARKQYIEDNNIDLIFSATKDYFRNNYSEYLDKLRWLPWSIDPQIFRDYQMYKGYDSLLMGVTYDSYPFRQKVKDAMKDVKGFRYHSSPVTGKPITTWIPAFYFVGEKYAQEINKAKLFFACGGIAKYPVKKYFEVPACNTLLVAEANQDILDIGFKDGENFVACTIDNFKEKAEFYLKNDAERSRITRNGYNLVHSNHTHEIRAAQLLKYITDFIKG